MSSKKEQNNAFNILMMASSSSKRSITNTSTNTRPTGKGIRTKPSPSKKASMPSTRMRKVDQPLSKFVQCPICSINVVESNINIHLDQCMMKEDHDNNITEPKLGDSDNKASGASKRQYDDFIDDESRKKAKNNQYEYQSVTSPSKKKNDNFKPNIFSQMMDSSKKLHKQYKPKTYRFHLFDDTGNVSWYCDDNANEFNIENEKWKAAVFIKGGNGEKDNLIISSSLPSLFCEETSFESGVPIIHQPKPLIQYPSKLSVSAIYLFRSPVSFI